jgi:hypothetical protein
MNLGTSDAQGYLRWLVAREYYDGAMSGVGERTADGAIVWFRAVAWDLEQWQRVFAVTVIDRVLVERLVDGLERLDQRRAPFWLPGPGAATPDVEGNWKDVEGAAQGSPEWWLVEAHDLIEPSRERHVIAGDIPSLVENIRAGTLLSVSGPPLLELTQQQLGLRAASND